MAGLAVGSALWGRVADRVRSPLRLFAALEAAIGVYGAAYPALSGLAAELYSRLLRPDDMGGAGGLGAKALVAGLLLLPPTVLMGGTFPAMLRQAVRSADRIGSDAAGLYAANAAGAVVGALAMAFALLPALGMRHSLWLVVMLNISVAAAAFLLARRWARAAATTAPGPDTEPEPAPDPDTTPPAVEPLPSARWLPLGLLAAAGFVSFAGEIAWTRYYSLVLGSSTYSFALIVAAFIAGIAAGAAWLSRRRVGRPLRAFGWTQLLCALVVLAPLPLYPYLPWAIGTYRGVFDARAATFVLYEAGKLLFCFLFLLPPTFLMGLSLPLVLDYRKASTRAVGSEAGRVYAWNTCGNVVGALAAGHVLLPVLGMEGLLRLGALLSAAIGFAALWIDRTDGVSPRRALLRPAVAVGAVALLNLLVPVWNPAWFSLSPFRRSSSWSDALRRVRDLDTLLFRDDPAANVMVQRVLVRGGGGYDHTLFVNGKADASSFGDMPTQILSAHVPLLLAPNPQHVLIIGLASGVTAGAALRHAVSQVDAVDVVQAMPAATRLFEPWNGDPFRDPRFRLIIDDARSYVTHARRRYDVIISEPSNPWMAGTGALFSTDFYAGARGALADDGIYVQWVQTYEMSDEAFAAVVRSFRRSFPAVYGFQANASDVLLLGCRRPLRPDWDRVAERFARPAVREHLSGLAIRDPAVLLALQRFSPATVDMIACLSATENNDDNRYLEHRAPRDLFAQRSVTIPDRFDERLYASPSLLWHEFVQSHPRPGRALDTLIALSDSRLGVPPLLDGWQIATVHLEPSAMDAITPGSRLAFPPRLWADEPPAPPALSRRISSLLDAGAHEVVDPILSTYSVPMFIESALSPEQAAYWRAAAADWWRRSREYSPLRRLSIDLLAAGGKREEAAQELRAWAEERLPPPAEWAVRRGCQLDRGELCDWILSRAQDSTLREVITRMRQLRAEDAGASR
jgi:spermidine synthase